MMGIPNVTKELVEYLEHICPDSSPALTTPEREIWFIAGKADLVRHLRSVFDDQNLNILKGS